MDIRLITNSAEMRAHLAQIFSRARLHVALSVATAGDQVKAQIVGLGAAIQSISSPVSLPFLKGFLVASTMVGSGFGAYILIEQNQTHDRLESIMTELDKVGGRIDSQTYEQIPSEVLAELQAETNGEDVGLVAAGSSDDTVSPKFDSIIERLQQLHTQLAAREAVTARIPSIPPVNGYITSGFGLRRSPFGGGKKWAQHEGIDIAAKIGSLIAASAPGTVRMVAAGGGYGSYVVIDHGEGVQSRYAHNGRVLVRAGDQVERGQIIGTVGVTGRATGPHLHFEILVDGRQVDPTRYVPNMHNAPTTTQTKTSAVKSSPVAEKVKVSTTES